MMRKERRKKIKRKKEIGRYKEKERKRERAREGRTVGESHDVVLTRRQPRPRHYT